MTHAVWPENAAATHDDPFKELKPEMIKVSLLGIPHDDNSSFMKGTAEAPVHIRRELGSDAYSLWSENGTDFSAPGAFVDLGMSRSTARLIPGR